MSNTITSPNMNLPVPVVGVDVGPQYAYDNNSCLNIVDGHNHSYGNGVQIMPSGLNINSDLPFGSNNATTLRSVRFSPQTGTLGGAADLGCLYVSGVDLYYNDESGNKIRITSGGTVNATSSGISNGTATASFVAGVLVVNAATNTPANIQAASILLGNNSAGTKYSTLSPPASLGANQTITLPAVPGSTQLLSMDSSGNIAANTQIDGVSIINTSGVLSAGSVMYTMDFEINNNYGNLSTPYLQLDGLRFFNSNAVIQNVFAWIRGPGSAGTSTIDLQICTSPGGSFTSIFSTLASFASTAGNYVYVDANGLAPAGTGVTAPVLSTTSIAAGSAMRCDLTSVMTNPDSIGITVIYKA